MLFMQPHSPVVEYVAVTIPGRLEQLGPVRRLRPCAGHTGRDLECHRRLHDGITPEDVADTVVRAVRGDNRPSAIAEWDTLSRPGTVSPRAPR